MTVPWEVKLARHIGDLDDDGHDTYGGGGSAVEILDEGVSLTATPTSIDFVGAGVEATAVGDAVTVTIDATAGRWELATIPGSTLGPILIQDTPAGSPLVFADLLQNDDGTDLLYEEIATVEPLYADGELLYILVP